MKKYLLIIAMLCCIPMISWAQSADNEDEVVKIETFNMNAYRPDEVIIKFKDQSRVNMPSRNRSRFSTSSVNAVDRMFAALGVDSVEELMPLTGSKSMPRRIRAFNGDDIEVKNLSKLYRLKINTQTLQRKSIFQVIDTLKTLQDVEYAEPNYIVYCMSTGEVDSTAYVSEPLYSQQWGPAAINLPALWAKPKVTTKRPVIAILDTGVDILHPDLEANIWTNSDEENGQEDEDDDANGFADDVHGWDFVNNRATIGDYNGHGTHCAGIAAAVGNNGIGITGANPDALIMPVVVMQSNGTGDVATIIRGIDYAAANGADVISMSIGGYSYSIAEEQALGRAYATAVLVAAAGNDNLCIYEHLCPVNGIFGSPMYPAALSFVLGVEASSDAGGSIASFSNFDQDGPIYTEYDENRLYNYELRAPGTSIYSTFPNGRYKSLNGTSMACPLAAGAISRLLQCKSDSDIVSKEVLFGDLIQSRHGSGNIDMLHVYNCNDSTRQPSLQLVGINMTDTISGDGDGRYDAGETIEWYPTIKNMYGNARNIKFWVKFGFDNQGDWVDEDTTLYEILNDTAMFGLNLSSYAKNRSVNPIRFRLSDDVADGRIMNITFFAVCDNCADTLVQKLDFSVENGVEIGGMITEDLTLYPNVHYIVTQNLAVPAGVTLTIKPGTVLRFKDGTGLSIVSNHKQESKNNNVQIITLNTANSSRLIAVGKPDSMIVFTNAEGSMGQYGISLGGEGNAYVEPYVVIQNEKHYHLDTLKKYGCISNSIEYAIFKNCNTNTPLKGGESLVNCIITDFNSPSMASLKVHNSNIFDNKYRYSLIDNNIYNSNVTNNVGDDYEASVLYLNNCNVFGNEVENNKYPFAYGGSWVSVDTPQYPSYWGSAKESIVRRQIHDINTGYGFGHYDLSNMLTRPNPKAHGIVWKVMVDGWDAQDQFDSLPPIGVGTHACDVYFNRAMDTAVTPYVTFGVRAPYTQHSVNANGYWSADSTIYHTTFTIDGKTASDGLNRFYVADAKDNEHFEIPIEKTRFNINIQATGSMSTGLMAEAGLGKVKLTWETDEEDFEDLLGYNIYRWTNDTIRWNRYWDSSLGKYVEAGWRIDTTMVNTQLIDAQDTAFTDFNVTPGKPYYYIIKQMTTSLNNYSISNPVVATPLTAQKGDANGSLTVDVADVVTEVNYMMGGNPEPFIFEAADVNGDNVINVLDVVGTINLVMNPSATSSSVNSESVYYYIENGMLYLQSDVVLGGVQLRLSGDSATTVITPQSALDEMEKIGMWQNSSTYFFMAYSMSGKSLLPGTYALLEIGDAEISEIVLSDVQGNNVAAIEKLPASLSTIECVQIMHCYPNPFRNEINIQYVVGRSDAHEVEFVMTDITGRTIATKSVSASYGGNTINWRLDNELMQGVYFVTLTVDGKKIQTEKVICQK